MTVVRMTNFQEKQFKSEKIGDICFGLNINLSIVHIANSRASLVSKPSAKKY